jgi:hypothetical protein
MKTPYVVYRRPRGLPSIGSCEPGFVLARWSPTVLAAAPTNLVHDRIGFRKNWLYYLRNILLRSPDSYSVYTLERHQEIVCQCIVTSASRRFGFMNAGDWQIGLVSTVPEHRRKGLALVMLDGIFSDFADGSAFWWLTEASNRGSRRLAERADFVQVSHAAKTRTATGLSHFTLFQSP